jgi:hypothetical protein
MGADVTVTGSVIRATEPDPMAQGVGWGIDVQVHPETNVRSTARIEHSLVEKSTYGGVVALGSDVTLDSSIIRDTAMRPNDGAFGDGLLVASDPGAGSAVVSNVRLESNARAAISNFGASVTLGTSVLECNAIDLDGEPLGGASYDFQDEGGNVCGCAGNTVACTVLSSALSPPAPLPDEAEPL